MNKTAKQHRVVAVNDDKSLSMIEQPLRAIGECEVLIAVSAFGINRPDLLQRTGLYPPPANASAVLGLEVAGTVIACGKNVQQWREGDRVCGLTNGGGYSDFAFAPAGQCLPWPTHYSATEAACLPETLFTVWHNLFQRGQLKSGETVLIHAGTSGIGSTAIQLAKLSGARVFTTAGSDEKCARCLQIGADIVINYRKQDFVEHCFAAQPQGIDVVLDILGGDNVARHIKLAKTDGRIVNIAVLDGAQATINIASIMLKRLTLTGSTLRAQSDEQKAAIASSIRDNIWPWISSGQFRPVIDSVFGFDDVELAHQRMQSREHIGKIAIELQPSSSRIITA